MKKSLSLILAIAMIISIVPAFTVTSAAMYEDYLYYYKNDDGGYTVSGYDEAAINSLLGGNVTSGNVTWGNVTSGNCGGWDLVIPSEHNGLPVTSIGYNAFFYCHQLSSAVIPDSVTSIDDSAFYSCSELTSIVIPDSVISIGESAFSYCYALTSITIPDSVFSIGEGAFSNCCNLSEISVDSNNPSYCSIDNVLYSKDATVLVLCPYSKTEITIPNSVTSIADSAFYGCGGLTSIDIPDSVTSIGNFAFCDCSGLTSTVIPNSVTSIGNSAFYNCSGLTSIAISDSVTSIDDSVFYNCSRLTSIVIPDSVISIGDSAFFNCSELTSIVIPDSVTSIGISAFTGCIELSEISVDSNNTSYCSIDNVIYSKDATVLVLCQHSKTEITIPNSVTSIADSAFYGCSELTSIAIPDSVISIGNNAFSYCYNLTSITIPETVENIGHSAFTGTPWYDNQPDGVVYIGSTAYAFKGDMAYNAKITIRPGTKKLQDGLFWGYPISEIILPDSLTEISPGAFYECENLKSITIPDSVKTIGGSAFDCSGLESLVIPDSVTDIGIWAFRNCINLTSVTIGNSVTCIGERAFYFCHKLASLKLGNSVKTIEDDAFSYCEALTSVTIPASVITIGNNAFGYYYDEYDMGIIKIPNFKITGVAGSAAESYANDNDFSFEAFSCTHTYGAWIIDTDATCTLNGSKHKVCASCGDTVTETIQKLGHNYSTEWTVDTDATCTADGSKSHHCTRCDSVKDVTVIPKTNHTYGAWIIDTAATCTVNGSKHKVCVSCGDTVTETILKLGHNYSTEWTVDTNATCTSDGSKSHHCTRCDSVKDVTVIPKTNHTYGAWIIDTDATCTLNGSKHKVCASCGDTVTESIQKLGHNYSAEWTVDKAATATTEGSKSHHCTRCDAKTDITVIPKLITKLATPNISAANASGGITIKWNKISGADGYIVYRKAGSAKSWTRLTTIAKDTAVSYTDKSVKSGTSYTYTVKAYYNKIYSAYNKTGVTVKYLAMPTATASNGAKSVTIKWSKISGASGYIVYRKAGSAKSWTRLAVISKNSTVSYTDKSVKGGTNYTYTVKAYNGKTNSAYNKTGFTVRYLTMPVVTLKNAAKAVTVKWEKITGATGYIVYRKAGSAKSWTKLATITKNATVSYTDKSVKNGTNYTYTVKAYYGTSNSAYNKTGVKIKFLAPTVLNSAVSGKAGITLKFNKVSTGTGYIIYRKAGNGSYTKLATVSGNTKTTYVDKTAKKGTTYTYLVRVSNGSFISANSNTKTCKDKY